MSLHLVQPTTDELAILLHGVEQKLKSLWGNALTVNGYEALSERISCVGRVSLQGKDAKYARVIVKHVPLAAFPARSVQDLPQELREEHLCYQYLGSLGHKYRFFAELFDFDERGFLILQDLSLTDGKENCTDADLENQSELGQAELESIGQKTADTLSALHLATFGQQHYYEKMRQQAGLPGFDGDKRSYSLLAQRRRYRLGAATVKDYAGIMNIPLPATWHQYIDFIEADIENPGQFHCFVHDDLANERQTIERNGQFHLIDFENAKFSHALLDLCKPLAGKFEMLLTTGEFFYANPNFPNSFIDHYRKNLFIQGNVSIDQDEWQAAFTHALIYHCLALIGKLVEISSQRMLRKSFAFCLCAIISRHSALCKLFHHHTPITQVLQTLMARCYRPELELEAR